MIRPAQTNAAVRLLSSASLANLYTPVDPPTRKRIFEIDLIIGHGPPSLHCKPAIDSHVIQPIWICSVKRYSGPDKQKQDVKAVERLRFCRFKIAVFISYFFSTGNRKDSRDERHQIHGLGAFELSSDSDPTRHWGFCSVLEIKTWSFSISAFFCSRALLIELNLSDLISIMKFSERRLDDLHSGIVNVELIS